MIRKSVQRFSEKIMRKMVTDDDAVFQPLALVLG
jgi:hypothetical protein